METVIDGIVEKEERSLKKQHHITGIDQEMQESITSFILVQQSKTAVDRCAVNGSYQIEYRHNVVDDILPSNLVTNLS